jgi:NAD(P)-dependent dehydrogenase (short-subunit alcohol dehydrogenase family)
MMRDAGSGSVINLGSVSAHIDLLELPVYITAKAGTEGLRRTLARELGPERIRVNCVLPGRVMTARQPHRKPFADSPIIGSWASSRRRSGAMRSAARPAGRLRLRDAALPAVRRVAADPRRWGDAAPSDPRAPARAPTPRQIQTARSRWRRPARAAIGPGRRSIALRARGPGDLVEIDLGQALDRPAHFIGQRPRDVLKAAAFRIIVTHGPMIELRRERSRRLGSHSSCGEQWAWQVRVSSPAFIRSP